MDKVVCIGVKESAGSVLDEIDAMQTFFCVSGRFGGVLVVGIEEMTVDFYAFEREGLLRTYARACKRRKVIKILKK